MNKLLFIVLLLVFLVRIIPTLNSPLEGKLIRVSGVLISEPREYGSDFLVNVRDLSAFIPRSPEIAYGSHIVLEGIVNKSTLNKVKVISVVPPSSFLSKVRSKILKNIRQSLPEPESALLAGTTIGAPNIPKVFNEVLRSTGTSHVVVASGENLAMLAMFLEEVFPRILKRKIFLPLIALILLIYSALTGFGAPIVRALVMWLIVMAAQLSGRAIKTINVLLFTILAMLIWKPIWIIDVSFWLSIGATSGVLLLTNPIGQKIKKFIKLPTISESLATSIAAQVGILPVSIFVFKEIQPLAPIWNTLVLWTVPYITVIGMLGSIGTLIFEPLGKFIYLFSYPFAWYFTKIISLS